MFILYILTVCLLSFEANICSFWDFSIGFIFLDPEVAA